MTTIMNESLARSVTGVEIQPSQNGIEEHATCYTPFVAWKSRIKRNVELFGALFMFINWRFRSHSHAENYDL